MCTKVQGGVGDVERELSQFTKILLVLAVLIGGINLILCLFHFKKYKNKRNVAHIELCSFFVRRDIDGN